jgi:hypothetical protein
MIPSTSPGEGDAQSQAVSAPSEERDRAGGVTARAIVIAFVLLALLLPVSFLVSIAWFEQSFVSGVPAVAQMDVLFLLAALMGLPAFRKCGLTRRELLVIYSVLLVCAPVVCTGILFILIPKIVTYFYLARANPAWETTFLHFVPRWYAPTEINAVETFFVGNARVPWSLWWTPLAAWLSFLAALFLGATCLLSILKRQWVTNERLSFPTAQIPLEMIRDDRGVGRLSLAPAFWLGLGLSFALSFMSSLSLRVPSVPAIPLNGVTIIPWQKVGPLAGLGAFDLLLAPWMIALAYIVPKELSFSCWFFWLVRLALHVIAIAAGASPQRPEEWWDSSFPAPYYQGTGAVLALGVWVLWLARRHLATLLRALFRPASDRLDRDAPLGYRWAVIGLCLCLAWMVAFCLLSGCRLVFALLLVGLILGYYVMWARLRAETGLGFLAFPMEVFGVVLTPFGSALWRPSEIVTLFSTRWTCESGEGNSLDTTTANLVETFKIADAANINVRRLTLVIIAGFVFAVAFGTYIVLTGTYHFGYFGTKAGGNWDYPSLQTRWDPVAIFESIANPAKPNAGSIIAIVVGAAVTILIGVLRLRFYWWPLHPIGYLAANCWGWNLYCVPFFLGWLSKVLVIRYGGLRLYRITVPVAIGLIVGSMLNDGLWSVLALLFRGRI